MVTLTGTYADAHGNPATGAVTLTPDISAVNNDRVITQAPVTGTLDAAGTFTVDVLASDDTGWEIVGAAPMPYIITEDVNGLRSGWMAYVNGPGPVDITDLIPLSQAPTFPAVDPALYQLRDEKGAPNGYVGLDQFGEIHNPTLSGLVTIPTLPANTAGDVAASLNYVIAQIAEQAPPATPSAVREFLLYEAATAPANGRINIAVSGQVRTFRVSKVDADGVGYSLAPLLPGDTVTLTDDPDTPPIVGWARYAVTEDVIDRGTYWEFTTVRTDTSGTQNVTPGSRVRFIPTLAGGASSGAFPVYEYAKVADINSIQTLWMPVCRLQVASVAAGVYESGIAVEWVHGDAGVQAYFRVSTDNGASWKSYTKENTMADEYQTFFYQFPVVRPPGPIDIRLEAKCSAGSMDINNADLWVRQVK